MLELDVASSVFLESSHNPAGIKDDKCTDHISNVGTYFWGVVESSTFMTANKDVC